MHTQLRERLVTIRLDEIFILEEIRISFVKEHGQGNWRKFYKYVVKKELKQCEVKDLMEKRMTEKAVEYWFYRLKGKNQNENLANSTTERAY